MTDDDLGMDPERAYEVLRELTSPIAAVTVQEGERLNGCIVNSAVRASLVPGRQRVAHYLFKRHLTHEMLARTGRYVLHITGREQWDEIWELGFRSGREGPKLEGLPHERLDGDGLLVLTRCFAWMECRVVNVMDAGSATFFMGDIVGMGRGSGAEVMDSAYFRAHMPQAWKDVYEDKLDEAQEMARLQDRVDDRPWQELRAASGEPAPGG